jgi:hypothetical protein
MNSDKHIFISYARRDGQEASARLARHLEQAGFRIWRDSRAIHPAQDFTSQIERGIASASSLIACITNDTLRDDSFVRREIGYALARAVLDRFDTWQVCDSLDSAARMGSVGRRKRVLDFVADFRNEVATNVLPGLFPDPDLGEYAQHLVGTMSGSAANMAVDRWEEYQRRQGL